MKTEFNWAVGCVVLLAGGERAAAQSWVSNTAPVLSWNWVAASADRHRMVALAAGASPMSPNPVYGSTDAGEQWLPLTAPNVWWSGIASSADGGRLVAVATGSIHTWQSVRPPRLNLAEVAGSLIVSWTVPSVGFVLQHNADFASDWAPLTDTPTLNFTTLQNEVRLAPTMAKGFYRLTSGE